ncbi:hypothetical protein ACHAXA_001408 [Cyclostephanos tholiformis]|uniref:Uncharacterized protein n=1 Tax=Cyclostephanos tholiformis TaxID=382380 RepID=A0ABD3RA97_9STRA
MSRRDGVSNSRECTARPLAWKAIDFGWVTTRPWTVTNGVTTNAMGGSIEHWEHHHRVSTGISSSVPKSAGWPGVEHVDTVLLDERRFDQRAPREISTFFPLYSPMQCPFPEPSIASMVGNDPEAAAPRDPGDHRIGRGYRRRPRRCPSVSGRMSRSPSGNDLQFTRIHRSRWTSLPPLRPVVPHDPDR